MYVPKVIFIAFVIVFIPASLLSRPAYTQNQDAICLAFIQSFIDNDPEYFIEKWFPTIDSYHEILGLTEPKESSEYYQRIFNSTKEMFLKNWQTLSSSQADKIVWKDVEYLYSSSNKSGNYSNIRFLIRHNHANYLITLGSSHFINNKWIYFDHRLGLKILEPKKVLIEKSAKSLAEELGFPVSPPSKGFKAHFYDKKTGEIKHEMVLDKILVDLGNKEFTGLESDTNNLHGIKPNNVGVYVSGTLMFAEDTVMDVSTGSSNSSKFAVQVDDNLLRGTQVKNFNFKKGKHLVEVRYEAGLPHSLPWIDFFVKFSSPVIEYSIKELNKAIQPHLFENTKIWYAGVYNSDEKYQQLELGLDFSLDPVILFIGTMEVSHINIHNIKAANVSAIIVSGVKYPVTVDIVDEKKDVAIYHPIPAHLVPIVHDMRPKLHRSSDNEVFDENHVTQLIEYIEEVTGNKRLNAFSISHTSREFTVPGKVLSDQDYHKLVENLEQAHQRIMQWK